MSETRDAYVSKLKTQIDQWNSKLDKLEAEGKRLRAEARAEYESRVNRLRSRRDELKKRLTELQEAGENRWQALRAAVDRAREEFRTALEEAETKQVPGEKPAQPPQN